MRIPLWSAALLLSVAPCLHAQIAVVTNPKSPVSEMSLDELRRVFGGKTTQLAGGLAVVVAFEPSSQDKFCTKVFDAPAASVHKRWVQLGFQGEVTTMPREIADVEGIKKFVASTAGAISFIPASAVDGTLKVLRIDGALPTDAAYKIK